MFSNLSGLKKAGLFYVLVMTINVTQILIFRAVAPEAENRCLHPYGDAAAGDHTHDICRHP